MRERANALRAVSHSPPSDVLRALAGLREVITASLAKEPLSRRAVDTIIAALDAAAAAIKDSGDDERLASQVNARRSRKPKNGGVGQ